MPDAATAAPAADDRAAADEAWFDDDAAAAAGRWYRGEPPPRGEPRCRPRPLLEEGLRSCSAWRYDSSELASTALTTREE